MGRKYLFSMPKELKAKWLTNLLNGKYKQARGALYNHYNGGYCCLGVLEHTADGKVEMHKPCDIAKPGQPEISLAMPSKEWCKAHGIVADWSKHDAGGSNHPMAALANMNDSIHNNFATIAAFIDGAVEGT